MELTERQNTSGLFEEYEIPASRIPRHIALSNLAIQSLVYEDRNYGRMNIKLQVKVVCHCSLEFMMLVRTNHRREAFIEE